MFNKKMLKVMINARLSEATEEIMSLFEQAVAEYQREIDRLKNMNGAKPTEAVSDLSVRIVQQTLGLGEERSAESFVNVENTDSLPTAMETEEPMAAPPEGNIQLCFMNVRSVQTGEKSEPRGQQQEHTGDPEKPWMCNSSESEKDSRMDEEHSGFDAPAESISCSICKKLFPHISVLELHMRNVHPVQEPPASAERKDQPEIELRLFSEPNIDYAIPKTYSCRLCDLQFSGVSKLRNHMRKHNENDPFKCFLCDGVTFTKESHFIRHMKAQHSIEKPFRCSVCDKCFKTAQCLRVHIVTHASVEERLVLCAVCGKTFLTKERFEHHMSLHAGNHFDRSGPLKGHSDRNVKTIDEIII